MGVPGAGLVCRACRERLRAGVAGWGLAAGKEAEPPPLLAVEKGPRAAWVPFAL